MGKNILNRDIIKFPSNVEKYDYELNLGGNIMAIPISFRFFTDLFCVIFRIGGKESIDSKSRRLKVNCIYFLKFTFVMFIIIAVIIALIIGGLFLFKIIKI